MSPVAFVTGAARGIGAATALHLAGQGWDVLAVDVCADNLSLPYALGTRAELDAVAASAPGQISAHVADVRDAHALALAVAEAEATWGRLDAAVACAGAIAGGVPQQDLPAEQERAVLDINLIGVLNTARAAVPALLRRPEPRSGRLVAVASAAATRGLPMLAAYCAAKAGVVGFVRALAMELAGTGITVNAVAPGSTDTNLLSESARLYGLEGPQSFAANQPIGRLIQATEVAEVIGFLLGSHSSAMTGALVPVDGGMTL